MLKRIALFGTRFTMQGRFFLAVFSGKGFSLVVPEPNEQVCIHHKYFGELEQAALVRRGRWLEYFTIIYNSLEGIIAIVAGIFAGSIALGGFGFDSLVEVTSGVALLWRLNLEVDEERRERVEAISLRIVGLCFVVLAIYVAIDSLKSLWQQEAPEESLPGIVLAALSLVVMPLLVRAKRTVARGIKSNALMADSKQTELIGYYLIGLTSSAVRSLAGVFNHHVLAQKLTNIYGRKRIALCL